MKREHYIFLSDYFERFLREFPKPVNYWGYAKRERYDASLPDALPYSILENRFVEERGATDAWWRLESAERTLSERFDCHDIVIERYKGRAFFLFPSEACATLPTPPPRGAMPEGMTSFSVTGVSFDHGALSAAEFPGIGLSVEKTLAAYDFETEIRINEACIEFCEQ